MKKQISKTQYNILALHATYDFKLEEGIDAGRLLCELASNVDDISKFKNKNIDAKLLASHITEQLIKTINSKKFQSSLKNYAKQEIESLIEWAENES